MLCYDRQEHHLRKGIDVNNDHRVTNMSQVLPVSDLARSKAYYQRLGFHTDGWGHADLDGLTLILRQAKVADDVRPMSRVLLEEGAHNYRYSVYDTYAYVRTDQHVDELFAQFKENGAMFAYEPFTDGEPGGMQWRRFGLTDPDGYVITFGAVVR